MNTADAKTPTFRPLGNRILVRRLPPDKVTKGGLFIPETAQNQDWCQVGIVEAVGTGRMRDDGTRAPMDTKVADKVMFRASTAHTSLPWDDELIVLFDGDVAVVVVEEEDEAAQ